MGNEQCISKAAELYKNLLPYFDNTGCTADAPDGSHVFKVYWPGDRVGLSISVPLDCNSNTDEYGWTYETALWNGRDIVYNDQLGYGDICRFRSAIEISQEITRLRMLPQLLPC
jgi:hypothetical protein